jgi:mannan endo-1,4-beta-mannosidase
MKIKAFQFNYRTAALVFLVFPVILFAASFNATITINTSQGQHQISPYIYGSNTDLTGTENFTAKRLGGNRMTGYNWENNASNAGSDWNQSSDNYMTSVMGIPDSKANIPAITFTTFIDSCRKHNCFSLITLPMAGYVAADKNGTVSVAEKAPSPRWKKVVFKKSSALSAIPDTTDSCVYSDEMMTYLETKYAAASDPWLGGCNLDNEPALWPSTHPRLHPDTPTCQELIDKSIALATVVKNIDQKPLIFGPVTYGFGEMYNFQGAKDWAILKGSYNWFMDLYLDKMKAASQTAGKRLLDVLDMHWYSEAMGNNERIVGATDPANRDNAIARMQAPRTLWDKHYVENSWIGQYYTAYLPLLPKVQASIDTYYPGTKISFSEYNYGGEGHISGGIAMADVLGIYGKYAVDFGFYWPADQTTSFTTSAFKLYRNYDGSNSTFGGLSVSAATSDSVRSSVYASVVSQTNMELHIILLNKNIDSSMAATVTLNGSAQYQSIKVWSFDSSSSAISQKLPPPQISNNSFTLSVPRLTACHCVLTAGASIRQNVASALLRRSFKIINSRGMGPMLDYDFPLAEKGVVSLYSLRGSLIKRSGPVSGRGTIALDRETGPMTEGSYLAVWKPARAACIQSIVTVSR